MKVEKLTPTEDPRCGTTAGYKAHRKRLENPCQSCRHAQRDRSRNRRKADPDKAKAENKETHLRNRDKVLERNKEYRLNNPDKVKAYQDKYRAEHKEERNVYRLNNLEKFRHYARQRKAQKLNNGYETYTEKQVTGLYGTDCYLCKTPIDFQASRKVGVGEWKLGLHLDHATPLCKGGPDTLENVRPSHAYCNLIKNAKVIQEENNQEYEFSSTSR